MRRKHRKRGVFFVEVVVFFFCSAKGDFQWDFGCFSWDLFGGLRPFAPWKVRNHPLKPTSLPLATNIIHSMFCVRRGFYSREADLLRCHGGLTGE